MRGRHKPPNAVPKESARLVSHHIDRFPTVTSHYSRAKSPKLKYLDPSLSVKKMHHLYLSWLAENHPGKKAVSLDYYRHIFRGKDLSFSPPNSDTCISCDKAKNGIPLANEATGPPQPEKLKLVHELQTLIPPAHQAYYMQLFRGQDLLTTAASRSLPTTETSIMIFRNTMNDAKVDGCSHTALDFPSFNSFG
ncbi:hypothetical protein Pmani_030067 [Petrolisthes manimaculis]|uniref:Uncharacterized protein n=1 Tax=Petrolisthes manimaculis TaxID=1843537 RepID=A0AAE1TWD1_9EUCA|nr:hypothetical protein Pmani_030067 [Petrolisthes manimaculis]